MYRDGLEKRTSKSTGHTSSPLLFCTISAPARRCVLSTPKPPKKLKAKKQEALAAAASQAEFDRLLKRAPQLWSKDDLCVFYQEHPRGSSHCGVWDDEGLAEAHDELDGEEEFEVEQRLLSRFGMSEYYGSEGFDRPPSDVYSYGGGYFGDDGAGA